MDKNVEAKDFAKVEGKQLSDEEQKQVQGAAALDFDAKKATKLVNLSADYAAVAREKIMQ